MILHYIVCSSPSCESTDTNLMSIFNNLKLNTHLITNKAEDMVEEIKEPKKYKAEELISRFRSKEDLFRYLTQQGK